MRDAPVNPSSRLEDASLIARCAAGEASARDELVARFGRLVYATITRVHARHALRVDDGRLDELFSSTFVALVDRGCRRLQQWDGRCSLASWVRLVAASTTLDALRAEARASRLQADGVDVERLPLDGQDGLDRAVLAERMVRLERALDTLTPSDRELIDLVFQHDLPPGEVARRLGIAPGALYTRKNRALERLKKAFGALADDDGDGA